MTKRFVKLIASSEAIIHLQNEPKYDYQKAYMEEKEVGFMAHKSMLMSYMQRKHRQETATAAIVLVMFVSLIALLAGMHPSGYVAYYSNSPVQDWAASYSYSNFPQASYSSTGLAASQSAATLVMWLLALVILAPIELALRRK